MVGSGNCINLGIIFLQRDLGLVWGFIPSDDRGKNLLRPLRPFLEEFQGWKHPMPKTQCQVALSQCQKILALAAPRI